MKSDTKTSPFDMNHSEKNSGNDSDIKHYDNYNVPSEQESETETLKELLAGVTASGFVIWSIFLGFVERKLYFTLGLWLGVLLAFLAACHMWWGINKAIDLGEGATKYLFSQNMVRYGVIIVIFGIICILDFANPLAAFAGIMCLKAGAYLQPFTHKIINKLKRR